MKYEFKHTSETKAFFDSTVLGKDPITEIVLEGEPGCGKTLATRWLAEELQVAYLRFACTKAPSARASASMSTVVPVMSLTRSIDSRK